jgi:hypothetical protein
VVVLGVVVGVVVVVVPGVVAGDGGVVVVVLGAGGVVAGVSLPLPGVGVASAGRVEGFFLNPSLAAAAVFETS